MRLSPISVNYNKVLPKTKVMSNPVKAAGLAGVGVALTVKGMVSGKAEHAKNSDLITKEDIKNKLISSGFKEENGLIWKESDKEENKKLKQKYGFDYLYFKGLLHRSMENDDLFDFQTFIESGNEAGKKLYNNNFESLHTTFAVLKNSNCLYEFMAKCNKNPDIFKLVENLANTELDKKTYKSISKYKGKAYVGLGQQMQEDLKKQAANDKYKIGHRVQNCIDNISSYIDKQTVPTALKLYRGEGCHTSLINVQTADGKTVNLGHMMFLASKYDEPEKIASVKEFILDNKITLKMPTFVSTSLDEKVAKGFADQYSEKDKVIWEFETKPNTKGAFIEGLYAKARFNFQNEVLLQKGSTIEIKEADYDERLKTWIIKASVSN